MKKGEIWMAGLNPNRGKEQSGQRPIVIISGNAMNSHFDLVISCPLSTKIKNFIGDVILEPSKTNGLKKKSEILVFQVKSISKDRLVQRLGQINTNEMAEVDDNLNKILKY
ncbi:MAG: type II toxin-antitoxin system PemK/MazF family toxin [Saprospiraceae bacterium]|nr:type II toxin-antitoxin system PemK/MazF family toxin [Saprospiraceae bacterium]